MSEQKIKPISLPNFDFSSLYQNQQRVIIIKNFERKIKIKKIFGLLSQNTYCTLY